MSPLTWMTLGALGLAVLQLAVMGVVFLVNESREARERRSRMAVMAAIEQEFRKQQAPASPAPLPAATVHRAGMSDPPYFQGGVFSWLPRDRMN